jgi:hypothetical protein
MFDKFKSTTLFEILINAVILGAIAGLIFWIKSAIK